MESLSRVSTSSTFNQPDSGSGPILPLSRHLQLCQLKIPTSLFSPYPTIFLHFRRINASSLVRYTKWDPNAEDTGSKRFRDGDGVDPRYRKKKRRWWSDGFEEDDDDEDEEESAGILEEAIDNSWIVKVFRSYGWGFPPVLLSVLLATGPKAFLLSMALPLGQFALSLAFSLLFGRKRSRSKGGYARSKRRPKSGQGTWRRKTKKEKPGFQSWTAESGFSRQGSEDDIEASAFGGWDELDSQASSGSKPEEEKNKWSKTLSREEAPLLLRLLIAMFPFLSSWTRMFW